MFDSCTFDVTKTSYTSNIIITPDGVARVFADVDIEFDGMNPHLQNSELGAEIEKRLQERHSEGLAGIADELIHVNTKLYYKFDIAEDAEPNYYDDFECDFFSWINPQNDTLIEETKIGDYLLTVYFLKADIWMDNDSTDDDYYDGDFDEPPTPDFGMDDWYPNDEW